MTKCHPTSDKYKTCAKSSSTEVYAPIRLNRQASRVTSEKNIYSVRHAMFSPPRRMRDEPKECLRRRVISYEIKRIPHTHPVWLAKMTELRSESSLSRACVKQKHVMAPWHHVACYFFPRPRSKFVRWGEPDFWADVGKLKPPGKTWSP